MIPPLDIDIVHFHQLVQDYIGSRSPVENIAYYMQLVDGKRLYQLAEGFDEPVRYPRIKYGGNDLVVVVLLHHVVSHVQQLVENIHHVPGNTLAHPGARVFRRHCLADQYQPVDSQPAPLVGKSAADMQILQLLVGIVDEICQRFALRPGN